MPLRRPLPKELDRQPRTNAAGISLCDHDDKPMVGRHMNSWGPSFLCTKHYRQAQVKPHKHPE